MQSKVIAKSLDLKKHETFDFSEILTVANIMLDISFSMEQTLIFTYRGVCTAFIRSSISIEKISNQDQ